MTYASRNTKTGLAFEDRTHISSTGIDVSKNKLYTYLKQHSIKWEDFLSRKLLPDEAYIEDDILYVYEKKFQQTKGSADEKLQTCGFKIQQFRKIGAALGLKQVYYTYILSDWFEQPKYQDVLDYIQSIPGCDYQIIKEAKQCPKTLDT